MRFLVAVDGSDHALRAVRHVAALARRGMPVDAVACHVREPVLSGEVGVVAPIEAAELRRRAASQVALASAVAILAEAGIAARTHDVSGDPAPEIARAAHDWNCDTIVVGRRGLGRIAGAIVGSVSGALPRLADVPVMVVP